MEINNTHDDQNDLKSNNNHEQNLIKIELNNNLKSYVKNLISINSIDNSNKTLNKYNLRKKSNINYYKDNNTLYKELQLNLNENNSEKMQCNNNDNSNNNCYSIKENSSYISSKYDSDTSYNIKYNKLNRGKKLKNKRNHNIYKIKRNNKFNQINQINKTSYTNESESTISNISNSLLNNNNNNKLDNIPNYLKNIENFNSYFLINLLNKNRLKEANKCKLTNNMKIKDIYNNNKYNNNSDNVYLNNIKNDLIYDLKEASNVLKTLENEFIEEESKKLKFHLSKNNTETCMISQFDINNKFNLSSSIPINSDINTFDFTKLADYHKKITNSLFNVIMIDPPWQIGSANPTRGVAISYKTLSDNVISSIPVNNLQSDGFIFIWTVNSKYKLAFDLLSQWNYKYCDEIIWIKQTSTGKMAKGNGYYLQHSKENCIIGVKGNPEYVSNVCSDIIYSKRRGQSQKPDAIYEYIEKLVPNGYYLEIFGRRNNLRNNWVTIGNEL